LKIEQTKDYATIRFFVTNAGNYDGDEVVQLYVKEMNGSRKTPTKNLRKFKRVFIKAGEKKEISFVLREEDFASWNTKRKTFSVRPGKYEIQIGASSEDIRLLNKISFK
jgi:beta-glucosidase